MGSGIAGVNFFHGKEGELRVTDIRGDGVAFNRNIFSKTEWNTLKKMCQENGILQSDLNRVFKRSAHEIYPEDN